MKEKNPGAIPMRQLLSIVTMIAALVAVIILKSRCGSAVGTLFKAIDVSSSDAGR